MILLVIWLANGDGIVALSEVSSKVNLLCDDTYRWNSVTVIMSSFGQIEQGAYCIGKSLIYSTSEVFLEKAVLDIVYKLNKKYYLECLKVSRSLKYDSIFLSTKVYV